MKRLLPAVLLLAGCSVGPDYATPSARVPDGWSLPTETPADLARWWTTLGDPELNRLVERALAGSPDLELAVERLRESRALRGSATAALLPDLDFAGGFTRSRNSEHGPPNPGPLRTDLYHAGFDASWELDIWGGQRRTIESAEALFQAEQESLRDTRVILIAEVVRNYAEVRGAQARLAVAERGRRGQVEILEMVRSRFDAGLATDLDVARAEAEVDTIDARVGTFLQTRDRAMHRLAVLMGLWPTELAGELRETAPVPLPGAGVPGLLPAEMLRRRPDVRRAERELAAASAKIGVAVDAMLPHLTLLGTAGLESIDSQFFLNSSSRTWSIGPSLRWRIFSIPQLWQEKLAADARAAQALTVWRRSILAALEDVENALAATRHEDARRAALARSVAAHQRAYEHAQELYRQGLVSFIEVLEETRSLLEAENELAGSDTLVAQNRAALYKALGGGWDPDAPAE